MNSESDKILKQEKEILGSNPRIHLAVAGVFLIFAIVLLVLDLTLPAWKAGAACGACFGIVAIAFVAYVRTAQSKLNLEIVKAVNELQAQLKKED